MNIITRLIQDISQEIRDYVPHQYSLPIDKVNPDKQHFLDRESDKTYVLEETDIDAVHEILRDRQDLKE